MMRRSLLVIDDDSVYHYTVRRHIALADLADRTVFFTDGEQALQYLTKNRSNAEELPDVILLDINMPVMDGWGFLEEYKTIEASFAKKVDLYVVTSSLHANDVRRANASALVAGYVVKPIGESELRAVMHGALND